MPRRTALATTLAAALAAPLAAASPAAPPPPHASTVFIAGDSTAAAYGPERAPRAGWGMLLPCAFDRTVRVDNRAVGGRSTRTFLSEGRLDAIAADLRAGDVLLIQFGHNDSSIDKPERHARADAEYQTNLARFVGIARRAGAYPVLLTPVPRRAFTGGRADESFPRYAAAMRRVAADTATPLIEVGRQGAAWLTRTGAIPARALYLHLPPGPDHPAGLDDDTHFSEAGARGIAAIVALGLRALALPVSAHVRADVVAPTARPATGPMACAVRR